MKKNLFKQKVKDEIGRCTSHAQKVVERREKITPIHIHNAPVIVTKLMQEPINCFAQGFYLATINTCRTLVECILITKLKEKGISNNQLKNKFDSFEERIKEAKRLGIFNDYRKKQLSYMWSIAGKYIHAEFRRLANKHRIQTTRGLPPEQVYIYLHSEKDALKIMRMTWRFVGVMYAP